MILQNQWIMRKIISKHSWLGSYSALLNRCSLSRAIAGQWGFCLSKMWVRGAGLALSSLGVLPAYGVSWDLWWMGTIHGVAEQSTQYITILKLTLGGRHNWKKYRHFWSHVKDLYKAAFSNALSLISPYFGLNVFVLKGIWLFALTFPLV